jgi:hypothetical protein
VASLLWRVCCGDAAASDRSANPDSRGVGADHQNPRADDGVVISGPPFAFEMVVRLASNWTYDANVLSFAAPAALTCWTD